MKSIKNWHPRRYPAPHGPRLMPHDYYLHNSGYAELAPGPVIFLDEPYWDDEGNVAGVERMMLMPHIVALEAAPAAAAPAKAPTNEKRPFGVRRKKGKR